MTTGVGNKLEATGNQAGAASTPPDELKYWLAFSRLSRVGSVRTGRLEEHFGSLADAWRAGAADLRAAGLEQGTVANVIADRDAI